MCIAFLCFFQYIHDYQGKVTLYPISRMNGDVFSVQNGELNAETFKSNRVLKLYYTLCFDYNYQYTKIWTPDVFVNLIMYYKFNIYTGKVKLKIRLKTDN